MTWVDEVVCSFVCLLESTVVSFDFVVSLTAVVSFDSGFVGLVSLPASTVVSFDFVVSCATVVSLDFVVS